MGHYNDTALIDALARYSGARSARRRPFFDLIFMWGQSEYNGETGVGGSYGYLDAIGWNGTVTKDGASSGSGQSPGLSLLTRRHMPGVFTARKTTPTDWGPFYPRGLAGAVDTRAHVAVAAGETFEGGIFSQLFLRPQADASDWGIVNSSLSGSTVATLAAMSNPPKILPSDLMAASDANLTTREKLYKLIWCAKLFAESRGQRLRLIAGIRGQGKGSIGSATFGTDIVADCQAIDTWCKTYIGHGAVLYAHNQVAASTNGTGLDSNIQAGAGVPLDTQILDASVTARAAGFPFYCLGSVYPYGQRIHPYATFTWGSMFGDRIARILWEGYDGKPLTISWTRNGATAIRGVPSMPVTFVARSGMGILGTLQNAQGNNTQGIVPLCASGAYITGVTLTNSLQIDVTLSGNVVAGDYVCSTGLGARYTNIREVTERLGVMLDINPYAPLDGAGNIEMHFDTVGGQPPKQVDISMWAASDKKALA